MILSIHCQENNKNKFPLSAYDLLAVLPPKQKAVVALLLHRACNRTLRISYAAIGCLAGVGRSTVSVTINKLREWGLISWDAIYCETNIFYISEELLQPKIKGGLMSFVRNVAVFATILSSPKPAAGADQPLYKNKEFIIKGDSHSYIVNGEGQVAYATNFYQPGFEDREGLAKAGGFDSDRKEKEQQEKRRLDHIKHDKLREQAIEDINKALPLTPHGRAKLFSYPAAALRFVFFKIDNCYAKKDPFIYVIGILERYCKENAHYVDRCRYKNICKTLGIDRLDNFMDDELVALIIANRTEKMPNMSARYVGRSLKRDHDVQQTKPQSHVPYRATADETIDRKSAFYGAVAEMKELPAHEKSWFHLFVIELAERDKASKNN